MKSDKGKVFVIFGIIILTISLAGILSVAIEEDEYLYYEVRDNSLPISCTQLLEGNHSYEIIFSANDAASGTDAVVRVSFILYVNGTVILDSELYARENFEYDENENPETSDSVHHYIVPTENVNLTLVGEMTSGDSWNFRIYRDIHASIPTRYFLFGILAVVGLIALGIGGFEEMNAEEEVQHRRDSQIKELPVMKYVSSFLEEENENDEEPSL